MNSISAKPVASIESALRLSPAALAEGLAECFGGYLVDVRFTPELVSSMIRTESIDLANSLVAFSDERFVAVILVSRRDRVSRIAAMAVAPAFRRKGHGRRFLERAIEDSRLRSDDLLLLEVVDQNEAALALYRAAGFQPVRRLLGFRGMLPHGADGRLTDVSLAEVSDCVRRLGADAVSWQTSAATIEQMASPLRGVRFGDVRAVLSPPVSASGTVVLRSVALPANGGVALAQLLAAIAGEYPGHPLGMPPYFPEPTFVTAALEAGLEVDAISQVQLEMRL